ncbi:hypothetical protein [Nocardioides sp. B-3]|uniref:hypothetical protein n=1 Tax=Nocardioides sp. B-3 TaxID=2895565 RepID=UPI00215208C9|nr:hypothetical protein [Nocardioides sp. B-3]UUZ60118.1 hypothetical protein LP418_03890 [Nocardioides sp. B-3]
MEWAGLKQGTALRTGGDRAVGRRRRHHVDAERLRHPRRQRPPDPDRRHGARSVRLLLALVGAAAMLVIGAAPASSHGSMTTARVTATAGEGSDVLVDVEVEYDLLMKSPRLREEARGATDPAEQARQLEANRADVAAYVSDRFRVAYGDVRCTATPTAAPERTGTRRPQPGRDPPRLRLRGRAGQVARALLGALPRLGDVRAQHHHAGALRPRRHRGHHGAQGRRRHPGRSRPPSTTSPDSGCRSWSSAQSTCCSASTTCCSCSCWCWAPGRCATWCWRRARSPWRTA